jgi:hypothetical protein
MFALTAFLSTAAVAHAISQPCDIYGAAGTPCVAAVSLTRALFGAYYGPLYQCLRASDNKTLDIGVVAAGGVADSASQDAFCAGTSCVVQRLYDQSGYKNHLDIAPAGGNVHHGDKPVNATRLSTTLNGSKVYAAFFEGGMGYRIDFTTGVAKGNEEETLYMVTSGQHVNDGCCFDWGNAESTNNDNGPGTMEAIYVGTSSEWGHGAGAGPWIMADLEDGLWAGNEKFNPLNTPVTSEYVTAIVKGGSNGFALKGGDATSGALKTMFDGPRPNGYQP